jgi:hypothetical protein
MDQFSGERCRRQNHLVATNTIPAIWLEQLKISADMKNSRQTILENHFFMVIYEPKAHSTLC